MKNQGLIYKIKSSYIIKNILNYIKDTDIQLRLFIYSKYFQNKLDIKLIAYKEKYLAKRFDIYNYLHLDHAKYKKDFLNKKYDNFLLENKVNKKDFENIIYDVLEKKQMDDSEILIDIESPLFEIISKTKAFDNNYTIYISQKIIDKYKLKNYYKKYFDNLNKFNIKYSSIYYSFDDKQKVNYLKELNIDFSKIKRISYI